MNLMLMNRRGRKKYSRKVLNLSPLAYWPLWDESGTTATELVFGWNGTYSGATLGQPGIGDGRTCPLFDGNNDYVAVHSAALASAFNDAEGSMAIWMKVASAGVWTDATPRGTFKLGADSNNYVQCGGRSATNNLLAFEYKAGGTSENATANLSAPTGWVHLVTSWSVAADAVKFYANGAQLGSTLTSLGTWAGSLAVALAVIGAGITTPAQPWSGWLAHAAVWTRPLTQPEITVLATVP